MALALSQADFTYSSGTGTQIYYFTIVYIDENSISVRNIQTPFGLIQDSYSSLPNSVISDIRTAITQVLDVMSTSAVNGFATFTAATTVDVTFLAAMDDTTYRVILSMADFVPARITSKTVNGFTIETGVTYTGSIGYDVFV